MATRRLGFDGSEPHGSQKLVVDSIGSSKRTKNMTKRNANQAIEDLNNLSRLDEIVVDKR